MTLIESDAFVFFGATGDLAYKKTFPALYAMVHRDGLNIPIIGVARAGWTWRNFGSARERVSRKAVISKQPASRSYPRYCATWTATIRIRQPLPD
jgi:glucose-6-phosphate 1-dehydrogenase